MVDFSTSDSRFGPLQLEAFRKQKAETKALRPVPAPQLPGPDHGHVAAIPSGEPPSHQAPALPALRYASSAEGSAQETSPHEPAAAAVSPRRDHGASVGSNAAELDAYTGLPQAGDGGPPSSGLSDPGSDLRSLPELQPAPPLLVSRPVLMAGSPPDSLSKVINALTTGHSSILYVFILSNSL